MIYKIVDMWLTPNEYSRPKTKLKGFKGIVVHWVANPMTTAKQNIKFFENRKLGQSGYGSAHELIDLDGSVWRCVPDDEMAYHVGSKTYPKEATDKLSSYPNATTYGIECTHIDWNGKMTDATYASLVERIADLCIEHELNPLTDVWLHKEVVGWKNCHLWFVNNPNEWSNFKSKVNELKKSKLNPIKTAEVPKAEEGDDDKLKVAGTVKTQMVASLAKMCDKNIHGDKALDKSWVEKLKKDEMTISEAVALFYIGKDRGLF